MIDVFNMSEREINWEINSIIWDIIKLQELVKNLEAELREIKKSLENNIEEKKRSKCHYENW